MEQKIKDYLERWKDNNGVEIPKENGQPLFINDYKENDDGEWAVLLVEFPSRKQSPFGVWSLAVPLEMAQIMHVVKSLDYAKSVFLAKEGINI